MLWRNLLSVCLLHSLNVSASAQSESYWRSVSIDLSPTIFFKKRVQQTLFKNLPYETVEVEVLTASEAKTQGYISGSEKQLLEKTNYFVAIESWQRFEFDLEAGVADYVNAIEAGKPVVWESLKLPESPGSALKQKLIKRGCAFRVVLVVQLEGESSPDALPSMAKVVQGLTQSRNVWAKIEFVGIGSKSMTELLPGVFTLLAGQSGVSGFMQQATIARQKVWDSFESNAPTAQVLGWRFNECATKTSNK